jgi:hypothetical protein
VIEGMLVALVRSAGEAARLASRRLGLPSIAVAFRLTHLAPWRTRRPHAIPGWELHRSRIDRLVSD